MNSKFNKLFSFVLITALIGTTLHCNATNIVPVNGRIGNVAVSPSIPVTKTTVSSQSPSGRFSLQSMKSKIDKVINPGRDKIELQATYSGTCGSDCSWSLDTSTGMLTISGSGDMDSYVYSNDVPWYDYRDFIKSVTIKNGVTSIGNYTFYGYSSLKSITIPDSVIYIASCAFYGSTLTSITIPNSVTSIGKHAFYRCSELKSITIPDSVTSIESCAFGWCKALKSVIIPDSVTFIGDSAFESCSNLASVCLGNNVTIGDFAFKNCYALKSIELNNNYAVDNFGTIFESTAENAVEKVILGNNVTYIGNSTFEACSKLTSVIIPNSVTSIGERAFYNCGALKSITIPDSVTSIGNLAFRYCYALTSINIPETVTSIEYGTFMFCHSLKSITIPDSVISIGNEVFYGCDALSQVCYLGTSDPGKSSSNVFYNCKKLASASVTKNYTDSSFCGKQISQVDECVESSATLSAKPVVWFIAATACLVPTVIFSFLM